MQDMTKEHRHPPGAPPIAQHWERYTEEQHRRWQRLFDRQMKILPGRACDDFLGGLRKLDMSGGIPKFEDVNATLKPATGWEIVGVRGLATNEDFFRFLSERKFPVTCFLRQEKDFDYLEEPDIFHDLFGHVPLLLHGAYADFMQEYGKAGLAIMALHNEETRATRLAQLARLYWYTIEFGLLKTDNGLRIFGAGILSSPKESESSLESRDRLRVMFDLIRVMSTLYEIDHEQAGYFVILSFEDLVEKAMQDFAKNRVYERVARNPEFPPGRMLWGEELAAPNRPRRRR